MTEKITGGEKGQRRVKTVGRKKKETVFEKNYSIQSIHRAARILRAFSRERKQISLTEMHKITGIGKSNLQRLLSTLVYEGFLQKNEETKRYQLGLELLFLGGLVEKNSSLLAIAVPVMKKLNESTKEVVSLSIIDNNERKCIYSLNSHYELTALIFAGQTSPLYAGASAKVLLAYLPPQAQEEYLRNAALEKITENTIVSMEELRKELETIRRQGYAISRGERVRGAVSLSAPVFNPFGEIFASVTITIPSVRLEDYDVDLLIKQLLEGTRDITNKLRPNGSLEH